MAIGLILEFILLASYQCKRQAFYDSHKVPVFVSNLSLVVHLVSTQGCLKALLRNYELDGPPFNNDPGLPASPAVQAFPPTSSSTVTVSTSPHDDRLMYFPK